MGLARGHARQVIIPHNWGTIITPAEFKARGLREERIIARRIAFGKKEPGQKMMSKWKKMKLEMKARKQEKLLQEQKEAASSMSLASLASKQSDAAVAEFLMGDTAAQQKEGEKQKSKDPDKKPSVMGELGNLVASAPVPGPRNVSNPIVLSRILKASIPLELVFERPLRVHEGKAGAATKKPATFFEPITTNNPDEETASPVTTAELREAVQSALRNSGQDLAVEAARVLTDAQFRFVKLGPGEATTTKQGESGVKRLGTFMYEIDVGSTNAAAEDVPVGRKQKSTKGKGKEKGKGKDMINQAEKKQQQQQQKQHEQGKSSVAEDVRHSPFKVLKTMRVRQPTSDDDFFAHIEAR